MNSKNNNPFYGQLLDQSDQSDFGQPYRNSWYRLKNLGGFNGNKGEFDIIRPRKIPSPPLK